MDKDSYSTVVDQVLLDEFLQSIRHNMIQFEKPHELKCRPSNRCKVLDVLERHTSILKR